MISDILKKGKVCDKSKKKETVSLRFRNRVRDSFLLFCETKEEDLDLKSSSKFSTAPQLLFYSQQLVILGNPVRTGGGTCLNLSGV